MRENMQPNKMIGEVNFSSIRNWMQNYNPRELLLWIQTIAVHPANMRFQIRFELLLGILFSIPPEKFKGNTLAREDVENLIQDFGKDFSRHLLPVEDYQPFDQLKLIPYFFKKRKYCFFYGALERPYEFLGLFGSLYLANNNGTDCNELSLLESLFVMSLEFQNHLLEKLSHNEEAKIGSEHVYVPTREFFDEVSPFFEIDSHHMDGLGGLSVIELLCATGNLFKTLFVHLSGCNYLLIPQIHLEVLFDIGNRFLKSSPDSLQKLDRTLHLLCVHYSS
jgi:hypothetical protein